jgi:hypothetical protein
MKTFVPRFRSRAGIAAVISIGLATSAGAATVHRFAISSSTGSEGATTVLQSSATGSALQGEVASSAQTGIKIPFGVLGEYDAAGSTFGAGTLGVSTTGYGVGAESLSATQPSLIALNSSGGNGAELYGEGTSSFGFLGSSQGGAGLLAQSTNGNGIESESATDSVAAIYAEDDAPDYGYGVSGYSTNTGGFGVYGFGASGVGAESETTGAYYPAVYAITNTPGAELYDGVLSDKEVFAFDTPSQNASGSVDPQSTGSSTDLQINGDIYLTGTVYSGCTGDVPQETSATTDCTAGATTAARSRTGATYTTYEAKHASETIEDEGETHLVNGFTHVTLDPAFASTIATTQPYLVFTTPMGESRGLYVTNRTLTGFDVRENAGGRSSMAVDYRIVAHPYGVTAARMAPIVRHRFATRPKSAKALARLRMIEAMHAGMKRPLLKSHVAPRSFLSYAAARR